MRALFILFLGLSAGGCIRAVGAVAKPTAIELQLLGAYEELDTDLAHASSLRASGQLSSSFEKLQAEALEARSIQRFNEDDVLELKDAGCLAEGRDAKLVPRKCPLLDEDPAARRRQSRVTREENEARAVILTWAAHEVARRDGRPAPSAADVEEIRRAYQRLLFETAEPGHLIETGDGRFELRAKLK